MKVIRWLDTANINQVAWVIRAVALQFCANGPAIPLVSLPDVITMLEDIHDDKITVIEAIRKLQKLEKTQ